MRFEIYQLPGAGRTRAWHHHGSHTPTSPGAILLGKAYHTKKSAGSVAQNSEIHDKSIPKKLKTYVVKIWKH